nr:SRPBCC family protein [Polymorphobacter sp.]
MTGIHWPPRFDPATAPVHVCNSLDIAAPPALVWDLLIHARAWPGFYANASNIVIEGDRAALGPATRFHWRSFGVNLTSTVEEFVPHHRIAWLAHGLGVEAYHAWLITPTATGCTVLTEETQYGLLARAGALLMPRRMHTQHQNWLEGLAREATAH